MIWPNILYITHKILHTCKTRTQTCINWFCLAICGQCGDHRIKSIWWTAANLHMQQTCKNSLSSSGHSNRDWSSMKRKKVHIWRRMGWIDGWVKHRTFTQGTRVCVLCKTKSQHLPSDKLSPVFTLFLALFRSPPIPGGNFWLLSCQMHYCVYQLVSNGWCLQAMTPKQWGW